MTKQEIGKLIQNKRKKMGLTQQALANQIGYERTSLQKVESGKRSPSPKMAQSLADILQIPVNNLLESPPSAEKALADQVAAITQNLSDSRSKRALNRMQIIESLFLLRDDELPAVNAYIKALMQQNGGIRHYEKIYNADTKADPNASYNAPDDD